MDDKLVIGLLGEKGAGKGTFVTILEELFPDKKIKTIRSGDILKDILKVLHKECSRENLQKIAQGLRDSLGPDIITQAVKKKILETEAEIIIFDGVRWPKDVELVKSFTTNYLVYVTADIQTRYQRVKLRKEKDGEDQTSFKQFLAEEQAETEKYIPSIGAAADFKILNNGSLEGFKQRVNLSLKPQIYH